MSTLRYTLPLLLLLSACTASSNDFLSSGTDSGKADGTDTPLAASASRTPWSGYYWSMANGELVLGWNDGEGRTTFTEAEVRAFDACLPSYEAHCVTLLAEMSGERGARLSPLMKFDLYIRKYLEQNGGASVSAYSHAARWELDNHYIGENTEHRYWDSRGYAGKCIGWALATMYFDEPTKTVELSGIVFKPADIKGFLASIFNGAQFFVPEDKIVGNAYHDVEGSNSPEYLEDVYPDDFVRALYATIAKGKILEGDLEPDDGVWNYPIHRYELQWEQVEEQKVEVSATIYYADDEVAIDGVFSTDPERADLKSRNLTFELDVPAPWNGDLALATGGRWTGDAVYTHPDALILGLEENWRQDIYDYRNTAMKTEVNFQLIKRFRTADGWTPIVDQLLADYYAGLE